MTLKRAAIATLALALAFVLYTAPPEHPESCVFTDATVTP